MLHGALDVPRGADRHGELLAVSLLVEELDPRHLSPVMRSAGRRPRCHVLTLPDGRIEHTSMEEGRKVFALPGLPAA